MSDRAWKPCVICNWQGRLKDNYETIYANFLWGIEKIVANVSNFEKGKDWQVHLDNKLVVITLAYYSIVVASEGVEPGGVEVILSWIRTRKDCSRN